jgi:hypothetical protein
MRAYIYTGGEIYPDNITEHPKGEDLVIAATAAGTTPRLLARSLPFCLAISILSVRRTSPRAWRSFACLPKRI